MTGYQMQKRLPLLASALLLAFGVACMALWPCCAHALQANDSKALAAGDLTAQSADTVSYRIQFNVNGGKGAMKTLAIARGKSTELFANKFTRSGYKFAGWNTKANGKGESYKDKAKVRNLAKAGKAVTLYAQWKKADKVSMWVVTGVFGNGDAEWWPLYKYASNGLVKRIVDDCGGRFYKSKFVYKRNHRLASFIEKRDGEMSKKVYQTNAKGYVVKTTHRSKYATSSANYTYDAKGRLVKEKLDYGNGSVHLGRHIYNKKGKIKKTVWSGGYANGTTTYIYDSKGRIARIVSPDDYYSKVKTVNKYKDGRVVKQVSYCLENGKWHRFYDGIDKYTYKKVEVPRSLVKMVKAQQDSIINGTLPIEAAHK